MNRKAIDSKTVILLTVFLAVSAVTLTMVPTASAQGGVTLYPWPLGGHDLNRTGYTDAPAPHTNETIWIFDAGGTTRIGNIGVAVVDGVVYMTSDNDNVYALDMKTSQLLWSYTTGGDVRCAPAVYNGKVYVTSKDGNVYCLDASTHNQLWAVQIGVVGTDQTSSPIVADGKVVVGSNNATLFCLDAGTGATIWSKPLVGTVGETRLRAGAAIEDGKVYVIGNDRYVYCLNLADSSVVWVTAAALSSEMYSGYVVVSGDYVYVMTQGNYIVHKLNKADGSIAANCTIPGATKARGGIAVAYDKVYGVYDDGVIALNTADMSIAWNFVTTAVNDEYAVPVVADGLVFAHLADGYIYALNATTTNSDGEAVWKYYVGDTDGESRAGGAVADGRLFIGSYDSKLYCFKEITPPTVESVVDDAPASRVVDKNVPVNVTAINVDDNVDIDTVLLKYSIDNVTFTDVPMSRIGVTKNFTGQIPGQAVGTYVTYKIFANDTNGNTYETPPAQYYTYQVIPEFPTWTSILLILIVLTFAIAIYKRRLIKTPIQ